MLFEHHELMCVISYTTMLDCKPMVLILQILPASRGSRGWLQKKNGFSVVNLFIYYTMSTNLQQYMYVKNIQTLGMSEFVLPWFFYIFILHIIIRSFRLIIISSLSGLFTGFQFMTSSSFKTTTRFKIQFQRKLLSQISIYCQHH